MAHHGLQIFRVCPFDFPSFKLLKFITPDFKENGMPLKNCSYKLGLTKTGFARHHFPDHISKKRSMSISSSEYCMSYNPYPCVEYRDR